MRPKKLKNKYKYQYIEEQPIYNYNSEFNLEIKKSNIKDSGLGVFNKSQYDILPNTFLGNYTGELKSNKTIVTSTYCVELKSENYIDAYEYPRCIFAMINDSRFSVFDYNCEFRVFEDHVEIWSIKNIKCNYELFIDYGKEFWEFR